MALTIGILHTISPCELATNITTIGYISRNIDSRHNIFWNGICYALGRTVVYTLYGFILIPLIQSGMNLFLVEKFISKYGEIFVAPLFILVGLFLLFGHKLHIHAFGVKSSANVKFIKSGYIGSFTLGLLFSLVFCPTSGVFYFGILLPLSASEGGGYHLPIIYSLATTLPVIVISWILAFSFGEIGRFYNNAKRIQHWISLAVALLFIGIGINYAIDYFL